MLNERALQRIRAINLVGDEIAGMFKVLVENAEAVDSAESAAALQYKTDNTAKVGEYVPQIHLVVTRVTEENKDKWDALPVREEDPEDETEEISE
jgi:hypothetical protein